MRLTAIILASVLFGTVIGFEAHRPGGDSGERALALADAREIAAAENIYFTGTERIVNLTRAAPKIWRLKISEPVCSGSGYRRCIKEVSRYSKCFQVRLDSYEKTATPPWRGVASVSCRSDAGAS